MEVIDKGAEAIIWFDYVVLAILLLITPFVVIIATDSIPLAQGKKSTS